MVAPGVNFAPSRISHSNRTGVELAEELRELGLDRGEAAVFAEGMDRPLLVKMTLGKAKEKNATGARNSTDLLLGRRNAACSELCQATPSSVSNASSLRSPSRGRSIGRKPFE